MHNPGTFSALNSAGSVSVNALSTESQCSKCTSARFETWHMCSTLPNVVFSNVYDMLLLYVD